MAIIKVYIQREIIRYLFIVLAAVMGIYLTVDFFERIDNFLSAGIGSQKMAVYFLCNIPMVVVQVLPICLLLSVIIAMGLMNKRNEIIALRSCGISFGFVLKPALVLGAIFTIIVFLMGEMIVPLTVPISNKIWIEDIKKKDIVTTKEKNIWMKNKQSITHIKHFNPKENKIYDISVYTFDDAFNMAKRLDARDGSYEADGWLLNDILVQNRNTSDGSYNITQIETGIHSLALVPEDLTTVVKKAEEMSFKELLEYIKKVEEEGYDATVYRVDLFGKTALPFVCIIMSLVGASIGVKKHIKDGLPVGIAYGIGIAFLYWIFYSFCMSLGYGGLIPPALAAWIPNVMFMAWGIYLGVNN